jgi:Zn-dependent metalloprotease
MKRLLVLFIAVIESMIFFANQQGHFFLKIEDQNVQILNVENKFSEWLDVPENSTFVKFRDETDELGIRHLSYQQYVDGIEVENGIVLVHVRDNRYFLVNGDMMLSSLAAKHVTKKISPLKAVQKVREKGDETHVKLKIVRANLNGEESYRYAYEVFKEDFSAKLFIDAETGEIIKEEPLVYYADVTGTAKTMYYGTQTIICYEKDGKYYLIDNGRNMVTLDATDNTYKIDYSTVNQATTEEDAKNLLSIELDKLIKGCSSIYNTSAEWNSTWEMQLKKVIISQVIQSSNWHTIGENVADVYIKIKDKNGSELYKSGYYDDPSYPVTFTLTTPITLTTPPYYIEIWDYDPIGDDDLIETVTISTITGDNSEYSLGQIANGKYLIESYGSQPLFDVHWGMEKTLDFYKEKFNRSSFDNKGSIVYNIVNPPHDNGALMNMFLNAKAIYASPYPMIYGMGMTSSTSDLFYCNMGPVVSVDIMAHEFTHHVTNHNGNGGLVYSGESGALNESFSDIMGVAVKQYATGQNNWLIGESIMMNVSNLRSLKDPHKSNDGITSLASFPQPKTYMDQYWASTENPNENNDQGGVHHNSGVQNYWFYLLSEGGSGTNDINNQYNVTGIGIDKAIQIAYRNLIYYLTPSATYADSRNGSIQAAIDLYGKGSQEHKSVVDAWYAVGVGDKYVTPVEEYLCLEKANEQVAFLQKPADLGDNIYCYMWIDGTSTQITGGWPGQKAISLGEGYFKYVIPSSAGEVSNKWRIIWHDNTGKQTADIIYTNQGLYSGTSYSNIQCKSVVSTICDDATALDQTSQEPTANSQKVLINGQLLILRGEKRYTMTGQEVQ